LEAMEEGNITIDGVTRQLPRPFFVMATQNPIEYEGTYPLPEAQLDRFLLKMRMGYPSILEEIEILSRAEKIPPIQELQPVITVEELIGLQQKVKEVYVDNTIKRYIVEIVQRSRTFSSVYLGVSPRGSVALMKTAQAYAFVHDRDFVIPDDVQFLAPYVLSHRIILKSEAKFDGMTAEDIVTKILERTPVPIQR
jgi:MoxR-like ATPase